MGPLYTRIDTHTSNFKNLTTLVILNIKEVEKIYELTKNTIFGHFKIWWFFIDYGQKWICRTLGPLNFHVDFFMNYFDFVRYR